MGYVNYSPWTDAANYGRGLGESLGQAMIQMPQQRMQLAAQQHQAQQQQQMEMVKMALQQQQMAASTGLGQHRLEEQERFHKEQLGRLERTAKAAELAADYKKRELEFKTQNEVRDKETGLPIGRIENDTFIPYKGVPWSQQGQGGGLSLQGRSNPMADASMLKSFIDFNSQQGKSIGGLGTNAPTIAPTQWHDYTNNAALISKALPILLNRFQQSQGGLGAMPPQQTPQMPGTNVLGMATNAPQKVLRWNPATNNLE